MKYFSVHTRRFIVIETKTQENEYFFQVPDLGTCMTDCDCPSCRPFCSAFNISNAGYCQTHIGYGRRLMKKSDCEKGGKYLFVCLVFC